MTLRAENLAKSYKGRTVVKDVSLTVEKAQIVGLLGPNGAGKTTSFYMIVGLVPMDKGRILLDDEESPAPPTRLCKHVHHATSLASVMSMNTNVLKPITTPLSLMPNWICGRNLLTFNCAFAI